MAKPVKRPARVKAGNGHVRRGITPASIPFQSADATVPRSPQVVIPKLGTETPTRTLSPGDDPPEVHRDATEHTAEKIYFREIGHFDRITPEEEVRLAKRIRQGDDEARQRMIHANLRLVVKIALDYEGLGLPLPDLINEGNIGLMKSVERFDSGEGRQTFDVQLVVDQAGHQARPGQSGENDPVAGSPGRKNRADASRTDAVARRVEA